MPAGQPAGAAARSDNRQCSFICSNIRRRNDGFVVRFGAVSSCADLSQSGCSSRSAESPTPRPPCSAPPNANEDRHRCRSPLSSTTGFPSRAAFAPQVLARTAVPGREAPGPLSHLAFAVRDRLSRRPVFRHDTPPANKLRTCVPSGPPASRPGVGVDLSFRHRSWIHPAGAGGPDGLPNGRT